jgi:hypothetical protein
MSRPGERVCLQDGLRLDLNRLARNGFIKRGANVGLRGITWTHSYWSDVATGMISADISGKQEGWFRIQLGSLDQWGSRSFHVPGISVVGNGILCAPSRTGSRLFCGNRAARRGFAADRLGDVRSPINPNSTTQQIAHTLEKCGSSRD